MANVIIGIHGLGNKPPKELLKKWWELSLKEGLKNNGYTASIPKFEMVYWADLLYDKPLDIEETDQKSPYFMEEKYIASDKLIPPEDNTTTRKLVDFLGEHLNRFLLNNDYTLNYSYLSDVLMGTYFKDLEQYYSNKPLPDDEKGRSVKDLIHQRLLDVLLKYKNQDIMLISHSMGSIIAYDVLTFVASKVKIQDFVTMGSPLGVPIVLSKIAQEKLLRGITNTKMQTPERVTKNWFNFSDLYDRVAFNYALADDFSENSLGIAPLDFLVENNYESINGRNPHKSFGYLRTAEFSKTLYNYMQTERLGLLRKIVRKTGYVIRLKRAKIQGKSDSNLGC